MVDVVHSKDKDFRMSENIIEELIQYKSKLYFDNINKFQVFKKLCKEGKLH